MSINAIVRVKEIPNIVFYVHWNGYPSAILPWLESFNARFTKDRGFDDPTYKLAQLVRSSYYLKDTYNLNPDVTCGYGLGSYDDFDWDCEYLLHPCGKVTFEWEDEGEE